MKTSKQRGHRRACLMVSLWIFSTHQSIVVKSFWLLELLFLAARDMTVCQAPKSFMSKGSPQQWRRIAWVVFQSVCLALGNGRCSGTFCEISGLVLFDFVSRPSCDKCPDAPQGYERVQRILWDLNWTGYLHPAKANQFYQIHYQSNPSFWAFEYQVLHTLSFKLGPGSKK